MTVYMSGIRPERIGKEYDNEETGVWLNRHLISSNSDHFLSFLKKLYSGWGPHCGDHFLISCYAKVGKYEETM